MLDRIPLRSTGWIVADGQGEAIDTGDGLVKGVLPKARPVAITASAVAEEKDFFHVGVGRPADFRDPAVQAVDGELGGVGGGAEDDGAAIPNRFVKPVGRNEGGSLTAEIVLVDEFRFFAPGSSGIAKVADELLFLGVHAEDRTAGVLEALAEGGDQFELLVAVGMLRLG